MDTAEQRRKKNMERIKLLRPIDDDFMRCLFKDNIPLVQFVLRIIIGRPDLIVTECHTQADMKRLDGSRNLILDVSGKFADGTRFNLEIERSDKGADPHRSRLHTSVQDVEALNAGQKFRELPDVYTIFITEKDFFGEGKPLYRIERVNLDTGKLFNDGAHIIYANGEYRDDSDIGKLMHDFNCTSAGDMNFELMAERTRYLKEHPKGAVEMCKVIEDLVIEERKEAREEARAEARAEAALRMLADRTLGLEKIAEYVGLPLEEVQKLQAEQKA